jgi:hypothetical protein
VLMALFAAIDPDLAARFDALDAKADRNAELVQYQIGLKLLIFSGVLYLLWRNVSVVDRVFGMLTVVFEVLGLTKSTAKAAERAAGTIARAAEAMPPPPPPWHPGDVDRRTRHPTDTNPDLPPAPKG